MEDLQVREIDYGQKVASGEIPDFLKQFKEKELRGEDRGALFNFHLDVLNEDKPGDIVMANAISLKFGIKFKIYDKEGRCIKEIGDKNSSKIVEYFAAKDGAMDGALGHYQLPGGGVVKQTGEVTCLYDAAAAVCGKNAEQIRLGVIDVMKEKPYIMAPMIHSRNYIESRKQDSTQLLKGGYMDEVMYSRAFTIGGMGEAYDNETPLKKLARTAKNGLDLVATLEEKSPISAQLVISSLRVAIKTGVGAVGGAMVGGPLGAGTGAIGGLATGIYQEAVEEITSRILPIGKAVEFAVEKTAHGLMKIDDSLSKDDALSISILLAHTSFAPGQIKSVLGSFKLPVNPALAGAGNVSIKNLTPPWITNQKNLYLSKNNGSGNDASSIRQKPGTATGGESLRHINDGDI
jgi:hypothetical protein